MVEIAISGRACRTPSVPWKKKSHRNYSGSKRPINEAWIRRCSTSMRRPTSLDWERTPFWVSRLPWLAQRPCRPIFHSSGTSAGPTRTYCRSP